MALWSGKGKTLARLTTLKMKSFTALKKNWEDNKHNKNIVANRKKHHNKEMVLRKVFQAWGKSYKSWKINKNKEDFEKAVKVEL